MPIADVAPSVTPLEWGVDRSVSATSAAIAPTLPTPQGEQEAKGSETASPTPQPAREAPALRAVSPAVPLDESEGQVVYGQVVAE
jgi:hypothetical protein